MPGYLNAIPHYDNGYMSNWWQFFADWDTYNFNTADLFQAEIDNGADCGKPCAPVCASCFDNIKNQGEEKVDCGGPCEDCVTTGCNVPNGYQNGMLKNKYEAEEFIIAPANGNQAVVAANTSATFDAGNYVELRTGFTANLGSRFDAFIDGCGSLRINPTDKNLLDEFSMKIYPNPLNNKGFIEFDLAEKRKVSVFITDITGKKIADLLTNTTKEAGTQQLVFERRDLPPGIYYCTLIAEERIDTKRLVITSN